MVNWDDRGDCGVFVLFGYCSNTSSSPFSLYFCGSLFIGNLDICSEDARKVLEPSENPFLFFFFFVLSLPSGEEVL